MANDLHFAVSIGINHYPDFKSLRYAKKDAKEFVEWLRSEDGGQVPGKNIKLITVSDEKERAMKRRHEAQPNHVQILESIKTIFDTTNPRSNRTVYVQNLCQMTHPPCNRLHE